MLYFCKNLEKELLVRMKQDDCTTFYIANYNFLELFVGKVYKGELQTGNKCEPPIYVAVKTLKENASPKTQSDFKREVDLMTDLRHPNIICLLGVILKGEPMCMLFEYMTQGDLHEFLICHSPRSDVPLNNGNGKILEQPEFLHIALQIASG
ncbi:hypothetical protein K0M31_018878 [Melipona bicolor]|uniref:Protein kinase domain-containing protein n=1 Tax=Melipona bicolor TaxID=60889 RepID=A0AA40G4X6_9HYME|nr:hypothetical protein K0M31_018878 [Melipona bicolor]